MAGAHSPTVDDAVSHLVDPPVRRLPRWATVRRDRGGRAPHATDHRPVPLPRPGPAIRRPRPVRFSAGPQADFREPSPPFDGPLRSAVHETRAPPPVAHHRPDTTHSRPFRCHSEAHSSTPRKGVERLLGKPSRPGSRRTSASPALPPGAISRRLHEQPAAHFRHRRRRGCARRVQACGARPAHPGDPAVRRQGHAGGVPVPAGPDSAPIRPGVDQSDGSRQSG